MLYNPAFPHGGEIILAFSLAIFLYLSFCGKPILFSANSRVRKGYIRFCLNFITVSWKKKCLLILLCASHLTIYILCYSTYHVSFLQTKYSHFLWPFLIKLLGWLFFKEPPCPQPLPYSILDVNRLLKRHWNNISLSLDNSL